MTEAATQTGQGAQDLSFVHAVRVLHRRLPAVGAIPPSGQGSLVPEFIAGNRRRTSGNQSWPTQPPRRTPKNE